MAVNMDEFFATLCSFSEVEAVALGGSRAGDNFDEKSDYDVYVYASSPIAQDVRQAFLEKYCSRIEIGNHFWEYEDNCTLNNGVDIDILYRNLDDFVQDVARVVEAHEAQNGYTTCMWHNLKTCRILCDKRGRLAAAKARFNVPYPSALKANIISRSLSLLSDSLPAYRTQIAKAQSRGDRVSVVHRTTAFLESYFDIIFALNEQTHPGEKRLIELCKKNCALLPRDFEKNLNALFDSLGNVGIDTAKCAENIIFELKSILQ